MKKRLFIAIVSISVLILSMTVLVSCGEKENDKKDLETTGEMIAGIDEEQFNATLNHILGYAIDYSSTTPNGYCSIFGSFGVTEYQSVYTNDFGEGYVGDWELSTYFNDEKSEQLYVFYYQTSEHASKAIEKIESYTHSYWHTNHVRAINNIVVSEIKQGTYEKLSEFKIPNNNNHYEPLNFLKTALNRELHSNNLLVTLGGELGSLTIENGKITTCLINAIPYMGNRTKTYMLQSINPIETENEKAHWQETEALCNSREFSTNDSYFERKTFDDTDYYVLYYQPITKIWYEQKDDTTLKITNIYFDNNVVEIPSKVNGIVVSEFDYAFLGTAHYYTPQNINVCFMGTIAQWNTIIKSDDTFFPFTIHCTDGDIAPTAE